MTNTNKILVTMLIALLSTGIYAQVGINTKDPKATLDIVANTVSPTADGILVPRLTAKQVKAMETKVGPDQNALLVYVTATFTTTPTTAKYSEITAVGYYYYDAPHKKWTKLSGGSNATTYNAGAGIEIGGGTISATGLERRVVKSSNIYDNDYYAWSLIGRDKQVDKNIDFGKPKYLPLGLGAVDLSHGEEYQPNKSVTGASGQFSVAMGWGTTASGWIATAMGQRTTASGNYATAMGTLTTASGRNSTAMGLRITAPYDNSTAMGMYNATPTNALLMVGNGNWNGGSPIYQNALTVYKNGDIEAKGIYDANGSTATKVVVVDTNGKLQSIPKSSLAGTTYTAGAGIEISGGVVSATGLERKVVTNSGNNYYSWVLVGRDANAGSSVPTYLTTGFGAVDLSYGYQNFATNNGATGASGQFAFATGRETTASGNYATALNIANVAQGDYSLAGGFYNSALSRSSVAFGHFNTQEQNPYTTSPSSPQAKFTQGANRLLSIGNGKGWDGTTNLTSDAFTVLANGQVGVDIDNFETNYTSDIEKGHISDAKLQVNGLIQSRGIFSKAGNTTDRLVVTDAQGVLKSIDKSTLAGTTYTAGAGIEISAGGVVSATGLERVTENGKTGWRLIGSDPYTRGDIGENAIDLSYQNRPHKGATGKWSVAMGVGTTASGENSIAMGYGIASGDSSTAMGSGTASGDGSTAMGDGTNTYNHESALACGKYNKDVSDMLFVIGNGRDDTHRSNILEVLSTGKVRVYGILTQSSDRRLKKDITPLSSASGILAKLRPVTYHWNKATAGSNSDEDLHYGFIAQEVEQVLPDLVSEDKDQGNKNDTHYKSINYIGLIPVLTKALQEKSAEIEVLKAQLQSQEARLKALESKLK